LRPKAWGGAGEEEIALHVSRVVRPGWLAATIGALALWLGAVAPAHAADAPTSEFVPSMLTFPSVDTVTGSGSDAVLYLRNAGGPLKILTAAVTGFETNAFSVVTDGCTGKTLANAETCGFNLHFVPTHLGPHGAQLSVTTDATANPIPAQLVGSGLSPPRPPEPVNIALPAISGTPDEGKTLSCSSGTWSDPTASFDYFWARGGAGIADANAQTYTIQYDDVGFEVTCRAFANSAGGRVAAVSKPVVPEDKLRPVCTLKANDQNMANVRSQGFQVTATCSEPVTAKFTLTVSKAVRRKYRLPSITIGTDEQVFTAKGPNTLRILISSTPKKRLRKAKRLKFTASVKGTDRVRLESVRSTAAATAKPPEATEETEEES